MVMANTERISKALDLLRDGLRPKCEETWQGFYGDDWLQTVNQRLHNPQRVPSTDNSDCDFLVSFVKGVSLFDLAGLQQGFTDLLQRDTDVASRAH